MLESVHVLGIALLIGPALAFDLRLLGVGRRLMSVLTAARYLLPVSHIGLTVAPFSGVVLLSAQATVVARSSAAPWKFGLLLAAGVNILIFHCGVYRRVGEWSDFPVNPIAARVSLIAWTGVTFGGRFLAYT